jgi:hypothetical protein
MQFFEPSQFQRVVFSEFEQGFVRMPANSRGQFPTFGSQTGLNPSRLSSDSTVFSEAATPSQSDGQETQSPMDTFNAPPYQPLRYQLPGALNALSSSPDGEYVVVAGREGITHLTEILIA